MIKSERLGLLLIGAALLVAAIVLGLWLERQAAQQDAHIRNQGVSLVRILSGVPYKQLLPKPGGPQMLQTVLQLNRRSDLGYAVIANLHGITLNEATSPGTLIPAAPRKTSPAAWFGERTLTSPGDGRHIREFFGPLLKNGEIAGSIRLGFFDTSPVAFGMQQLSFAAMLALPVFLLAPLFYFLMKREMRPLRDLGERLEPMLASYQVEPAALGDLRDLAARLAGFIEATRTRIRDIEAQRFTAQTKSHMLTYRQEKAESVLHALPEALMVLDDDGIVTFANAKLKVLLGVEPDAIVGKKALEALPGSEVAAFLAGRTGNTARRGEALEFAHTDDPERRIAANAYPLFSPRDPDTTLGLLVVFRDVTAEFFARQAGAEFVSHVSHELKSPLNVLRMYSEMLQENGDQQTLRIEAVNVIGDQVVLMAELIDNLLSVSKIEQGSICLDRQRVRLRDLFEDVVTSATRAAAQKGVEVQMKVPHELSPVLLDKNLSRIAIGNLLGNAVKYTQPGGKVTLSAEESDARIAVRVRDSGIGIEREDLPKVFGKFFRAANAHVAASGHGLGLYLAKQIAELHQGSISVTSEPGKGSEFTITLHTCDAMAQTSAAI